jgi:hypothetical protein
MTPFSYIQNCVNIKLAPSTISGIGVFALRNISKGETLFQPWQGITGSYPILQSELDILPLNIRNHIYDMFQFKKEDNGWVFRVDLTHGCFWIFNSPTHWINSCSWDEVPNIDVHSNKSLSFIPTGTELLTKYGKYNKHEKLRAI